MFFPVIPHPLPFSHQDTGKTKRVEHKKEKGDSRTSLIGWAAGSGSYRERLGALVLTCSPLCRAGLQSEDSLWLPGPRRTDRHHHHRHQQKAARRPRSGEKPAPPKPPAVRVEAGRWVRMSATAFYLERWPYAAQPPELC